MWKFFGVSRFGYFSWMKHIPFDREKCNESIKDKIQDIYDESKQN